MVLPEPQEPGRVGVAVKPMKIEDLDALMAAPDPEELKDALGRAKSSLTVIENPSLDGNLGILMAATTILDGDNKAFIDAYRIIADTNYIYRSSSKNRYVKTVHQSGNPPLYVVVLNEEGRKYWVASLLPHEVCKIADYEFERFETSVGSDENLDGVVRDMVKLLGERVNSFKIEEGKLVLPPNYANTSLLYF